MVEAVCSPASAGTNATARSRARPRRSVRSEMLADGAFLSLFPTQETLFGEKKSAGICEITRVLAQLVSGAEVVKIGPPSPLDETIHQFRLPSDLGRSSRSSTRRGFETRYVVCAELPSPLELAQMTQDIER